ncbi:hypothetical protein FZEAL_3078 [Fusarium zealandicum]|uniref:Uncharacterized protein n=1 Tax=Fusarium zealandicum TaxID=1053134 RepID=A0A8H4XM54_9HYPO|nr:hypothetical protein FZEAL_3078 [Fusarium zealandicum]
MDTSLDTRQLSASLEADANGPTLYTRVEKKPILPLRTGLHQNGDRASDSLDDRHGLVDCGWNERTQALQPLAEGLSNEDLWLLIRRFNKRIYHLKKVSELSPMDLDFEVAKDENFSPNKLRAQLERLYMGVLFGLLVTVQHMSRLRSWREPRRTSLFCVGYFAAWYANFLVPALVATLMTVLMSPEAREYLFPPVPPALVNYETGGLTKPPAGLLGSFTSATGAPENIKGEALENEASNFVIGLIAIAVNVWTDEDPQHHRFHKGGGVMDAIPKPNDLACKMATAKDKSSGIEKPSNDKTKNPMQKMMWSKMRPMMHGMCLVSDTWERCAKLGTLAIGMGFFGGAVLTNICRCLKLQTLNVIELAFKRVPTDSQLVITLLRFAEARKAPLVPPPVFKGPPDEQYHTLGPDGLESANGDHLLGATQDEIRGAANHDTEMLDEAGGDDHESTETGSNGKKRGSVLSVLRSSAKAAVKTAIGVDKIRAKVGSESAKNRVGAAAVTDKPPIAGPIEFTGRYQGEKGFIYLTTDAASPYLCFSTKPSQATTNSKACDALVPELMVPVAEMTELNKYSGYGVKSKLIAGWALEGGINDGIEIKDMQGRTTLITAMAHRDELFNRLCAIGSQKWEIW